MPGKKPIAGLTAMMLKSNYHVHIHQMGEINMFNLTKRITVRTTDEHPQQFTIGDVSFVAFPCNHIMGEVHVKSLIDAWDEFIQFIPVNRPVGININADGVSFDY